MPAKTASPVITTLLANLSILLIANALTIYFYATGHGSVWQVLLTYYVQTVVLVVFYYKRILGNNVTQIAARMPQAPLGQKIAQLYGETHREQSLFLLVFGAPLAVLTFALLFNYSGTTLFGVVPMELDFHDAQAIAIGSGLFLVHHLCSYLIDRWEYTHGHLTHLSIPAAKIGVRVFTLFGLLFLLPVLISQHQLGNMFYAFMLVKTLLDVVLSSSYVLLKAELNSGKSVG